MGILRLLGRNNSGEIARKRLKLLLASDRAGCSPDMHRPAPCSFQIHGGEGGGRHRTDDKNLAGRQKNAGSMRYDTGS